MFVELPSIGIYRLFQHSPDLSTAQKQPKQSTSIVQHANMLDLLFSQPWNAAPWGVNEVAIPKPPSATEEEIDREDVLEDRPLPDTRVVISQEGTVTAGPRVLFDSKSVKQFKGGKVSRHLFKFEHRRSHSGHDPKANVESQSPRRSSVSVVQEHGENGRVSKDSRTRSLNLSGDNIPRKVPRDSLLANNKCRQDDVEQTQLDDAKELVECVFGSSGLPSVASTKFHIRPPKGALDPHSTQPASRLPKAQGFSSPHPFAQNPSINPARPQISYEVLGHDGTGSTTEVLTLLVTRIFAINVSKDSGPSRDCNLPKPPPTSETYSGGSGQLHADGVGVEEEGKTIHYKSPKYAVTMVLNVPISSIGGGASPAQPNSLRTGATNVPYDDGMQYVMGHWVNLMRGVRRLEASARLHISRQLEQLYSQVDGRGSLPQEPEMTTGNALAYKKPTFNYDHQRNFHLATAALQDNKAIQDSSTMTAEKLREAFCIRRVVTASKNWGAWKNQARFLSLRLGRKPQNFFLLNILTAFLGTHINWLHPLALKRLKQHKRTEVASVSSEDIIFHRTILVCPNGDIGRRMIYILAIFMPVSKGASDRSQYHSLSPCSNLSMSQSPPLLGHPAREPSLRRSVGRRAGASMLPATKETISMGSPEAGSLGSLSTFQHSPHRRRMSDTRSIRSLAVPVPQADSILCKSSAGVVSATVPIRQVSTFGGPSPRGTSAEPRPGSSGSLAALSLQRTLSRSESSNLGSPTTPSHSRWGSVMSGFWSLGRRSSTEQSEGPSSFDDGLGISGIRKVLTDARQSSRLIGEDPLVLRDSHVPIAAVGDPLSPTIEEFETEPLSSTPAKDIPLPAKIEEYPLRFSVDEVDGVVDIELPPDQSYPSSLDSSNTGTAASSFNDHVSTYDRRSSRPHQQAPMQGLMEIAGYLHDYHPDFILQAVKPSWKLKSDIIRSLRDEASQYSGSPRQFSALLADATTFTILRLTLDNDAVNEEAIMDLDSTFVDAVERLIVSDEEAKTDKECEKVIWSALESVVKSVIAEEEEEAKTGTEKDDNILREGIRRWVRERRVAH